MQAHDQAATTSPVYGVAHTGPHHRSEPREARNAIVVAQQSDSSQYAWFRVELIDSSTSGMGLECPIPIPPGIELTVHLTPTGGPLELLRCCVRHCTRQESGRFHIGVAILERS